MEQLRDDSAGLSPDNPGSFNDFKQAHPDFTGAQLPAEYSNQLDQYADQLAAYYVIDRGQLHANNLSAQQAPRRRLEA